MRFVLLSFFFFVLSLLAMQVDSYMRSAPAASQDLFTRAANGSIPSDPMDSGDPDHDPLSISTLAKCRSSSKSSSKSTAPCDASSKATTATLTPISESAGSIASGSSHPNPSTTPNPNPSAHSSSSSSQNSKNIHLNPFYELSRMTAADMRNYRYNSGLEDVDSW